jgi:hypothetical protein
MTSAITKIDEIDYAVHEIEKMCEFAIRAAESLQGKESDKQKFEMPADDAQLLDFALLDVAKRLTALREIIERRGDDNA